MPAYFPNVGRMLTLDILLAAGRSPKLKLFKNDVALSAGMILGDLIEADFSGYAYVDLSQWVAAHIRGDGKGAKVSNANNFTRDVTGNPQLIYGWYITIFDLGNADALLILRKFSAPVLVETAGHFVQFDLEVLDDLGT